ncbi:P-type conjugative transfer ATPase TrbB, partial [Mesorhizobium sp. M2A.F.Ca.ET.046.02.1.1]
MSTHPETDHRRHAMLRTALGPAITEALADPLVIEVMVNPDGALRLDRLGDGRVDTD